MGDDFNKYNNKLIELYEKNPNRVTRELKNLVSKLENNNNNGILKDVDKEKLAVTIMCIAFFLIGFINVFSGEPYTLYFAGLIFFLAGFFVGTSQKGMGLVFLFSHGITGLCLMVGFTLSDVFKSPLMHDNPIKLYVYLAIALIIFIVATMISVLRNLSDNFKERKYSLLLPLILYFFGMFMVVIFPKIYELIYSL